MAVCKNRDTKAELNRRGQICEVLIDAGISHRGNKNPKRTESGVRPLLRPCGVSADEPDSLGKWTGMRVMLSLFRFVRPTCVYQHLCPKKWNPVLELHQPLRFCKPPPQLLGQRDVILTSTTKDRSKSNRPFKNIRLLLFKRNEAAGHADRKRVYGIRTHFHYQMSG